jgi:release factor glutamine methyltransferase
VNTPSGASLTGRQLLAEVRAVVGDDQEARWITAAALDAPPAALAVDDSAVPEVAASVARCLAARRAAGEPLQYVLGRWGFRRLDLLLDDRVLIPRPETEHVVGIALECLAELVGRGAGADGAERPVAADLGTGSGAIALSLALEGPPDLEVWATDRSPEALAVARANLALVEQAHPAVTGRVQLVEGDWFAALPTELAGHLQLIVANPPYVAEGEWTGLDPVVREHEPPGALVAGPSGLEDVAAIVTGAPSWLAPGGAVVIELAPAQAADAVRLAAERGLAGAAVLPDLAGRPRALVGRRPSS